MKIKLFVVLVLLAHVCHAQIEGTWNGELDTQTMKLPVILKIKKDEKDFSSTLNSPKQSTKEFPADKTEFSNNELSFEIQKLGASYKGIYKTDHFEGFLLQNGRNLPLNLFKGTEPRTSSDLSFLSGKAIDTKKIDNFLDHIATNNQGIGSVSIFRNGSEVYRKDFGQHMINNAADDKNTLYQIGSISKLMTAVMLHQLIENEKLSMNDQLSKFYPDIPNAQNITIKTMLNHTSGLGDYVGKSIENNWLFGKPVGNDAIIKAIKKEGVSFQPGQKMQYSNSAYFLLSRILENIYQQPYHQILREKILKKAGMNHTFSVLDHPEKIFKPYEYKDMAWTEVKDFNFQNCIGLGDITSTPEDLNIFINSLFTGKFIKNETVDMMISDKNEKLFGSGIIKMPFYNITLYGHGGDTAGTHSTVSYEPADQLSFAVTINGENYPHNSLFIVILNLIYAKDFPYPVFEAAKNSLSELEKYTGDYISKDIPLGLKIFVKNDKLFAEGTGQPEFELTYAAKDRFTFDKVELEINFIPEKEQFQLLQRGKRYLFGKKQS